MFLDKNMWLFYVILAGLSWGTYVPIIFYGGSELGGKANARLMAILCVGGAYFVWEEAVGSHAATLHHVEPALEALLASEHD